MVLVLIASIYCGAWAGITIAEHLSDDPALRIAGGFVGCMVAALLVLVGAAATGLRRPR